MKRIVRRIIARIISLLPVWGVLLIEKDTGRFRWVKEYNALTKRSETFITGWRPRARVVFKREQSRVPKGWICRIMRYR